MSRADQEEWQSYVALRGVLSLAVTPMLWRISAWFLLVTAFFLYMIFITDFGRKVLGLPVPRLWLLATGSAMLLLTPGWAAAFLLLLALPCAVITMLSPSTEAYWGIKSQQ